MKCSTKISDFFFLSVVYLSKNIYYLLLFSPTLFVGIHFPLSQLLSILSLSSSICSINLLSRVLENFPQQLPSDFLAIVCLFVCLPCCCCCMPHFPGFAFSEPKLSLEGHFPRSPGISFCGFSFISGTCSLLRPIAVFYE